MKLRIAKTVFWFFAGLGLTIFVLRIINGPGSVTALSDIIPWGLWKGGGVVALVAVGGAGFTLAMFVHIFRWKRYKPLVRGAVLFALMCYSSVALGLTIDIGIWWRIVFPVFHWQFHSVLFEVAWCIILYLCVLALEFGHTVFEKFEWTQLLKAAGKATTVIVIVGIALSTLHQSSLGTLFLAAPFRLHPLWHTDFLPLLFFISAIAVGCLTITIVTIFVHWLYDAKPPMDAIAGVGRIAAFLLIGYGAIRFAEIAAAGEAGLLAAAGWDTANFWIETLMSTILPAALLLRAGCRRSPAAMFWIGVCATAGIVLNRVNVAGLATLSLTSADYVPAWSEWAMTLGVLSGAALVYLFCVEYFGLFDGVSKSRVQERYAPGTLDHTDWRALFFGSQRLGETGVYSMAFVFAAAAVFLVAPGDAVFGVAPEDTPVKSPRVVDVAAVEGAGGSGRSFAFFDEENLALSGAAGRLRVLMIDGNRDGRFVLFDHDDHVGRFGGGADKNACVVCHHMRRSVEAAAGCHECHSDMYLPANIFVHALHQEQLGGNDGCAQCHPDPDLPKTMANAAGCLECHKGMRPAGSRVASSEPASYSAAGYMDAMHGLCVSCHSEEKSRLERPIERFDSCECCHRFVPEWERAVKPSPPARPAAGEGAVAAGKGGDR